MNDETEFGFTEKDLTRKEILNMAVQPVSVPMKICKSVIKGLLIFTGALLILVGYITAIAFFTVGMTSLVTSVWNYTAGAGGAFLISFGGGLLLISFTAPLFYASTFVLRKYIEKFTRKNDPAPSGKGCRIEVN